MAGRPGQSLLFDTASGLGANRIRVGLIEIVGESPGLSPLLLNANASHPWIQQAAQQWKDLKFIEPIHLPDGTLNPKLRGSIQIMPADGEGWFGIGRTQPTPDATPVLKYEIQTSTGTRTVYGPRAPESNYGVNYEGIDWRFGDGEFFGHQPTSGLILDASVPDGSYLVGSFKPDLKFILRELNYPVADVIDYSFSVPQGQKFNLLNIGGPIYEEIVSQGGFFTKVNGPWIDAGVQRGNPFYVASDIKYIYSKPIDPQNGVKTLTGFGKEIHRLEWVHGYRYDPVLGMMVPPRMSAGLKPLTMPTDYVHK